MNRARWRLVERVLDRALASDPSVWPALLDDMCRNDPELQVEVEALLSLRDAAEGFLASPPAVAASAVVADAAETNAGYEVAAVLAWLVRRYEQQGQRAEAADHRALLDPPRP